MNPSSETLDEPTWRARQRGHEARVRQWTEPHQARAARGEKHPVYDFLFDYYAFRASWLRRWHPGIGVSLAGETAQEFLRWREYRATAKGIAADPSALPPHRRDTVVWLRDLLVTMQERPAFFGCFGFHEWAMVYRESKDAVRHSSWPLRFSPDDLAQIIETQTLCCTHYDAFRFFTPPARPRNRWQPTRETLSLHEQRGCLHANMDLYKWASKLVPFTPSELVADCFALAREIREVDMRASPYDLRELGFAPIRIETPEGRSEYESRQRVFAERGQPLRQRLIEICARILAAS